MPFTFNNPDLPETRSEMALPLVQAGGQVIGVLDIQSTEPNAFKHDDIEILITLADQVSMAITNARLYEDTQKNLLESDMLYRRDLQTGWKKFSQHTKNRRCTPHRNERKHLHRSNGIARRRRSDRIRESRTSNMKQTPK